MRIFSLIPLLCLSLLIVGCGQDKTVIPADAPGYVNGKPVHPTIKIGKPYRIGFKKYYPKYDPNYNEEGVASWYGPNFHGKSTANGETYNQWAMTAAHPTLPMPSMVRVTNLTTQQSVIVRVNDRGPFAEDRIIDLSRAAAEALGTHARGVAPVRVEYLRDETEKYIAKLQLKKPDDWDDIEMAQAKQEEGWKTSNVELPDQLPAQHSEAAADVPEHFAYESATPETTTVAARGVVMEEIGYEEDAFSVLGNEGDAVSSSSKPLVRFTNTPQPAMPASVPPSVAERGKQIFVRVGTFSVEDNATQLAQRLQSVAPARVRASGAVWVVELGPVFNQGIASELQTKLQQHGISDATIVED